MLEIILKDAENFAKATKYMEENNQDPSYLKESFKGEWGKTLIRLGWDKEDLNLSWNDIIYNLHMDILQNH